MGGISNTMVDCRGKVEKNYHARMLKEFGFPKDSFRHAHCNWTTILEGTTCQEAMARSTEIIKNNKENHADTRGKM